MKIHDINPERTDVILLLHPMFATAELMNILLAKPLGDGYRYLIPDLAGHGEASDQIYESAEQEAKMLSEYLMVHHITKIHLAFGASLGGAVLMELLQQPQIEFGQLFFEGVSFLEHAGFTGTCAKKILVSKHRKAVKNPDIAVKRMGKLYGAQAAQIMAQQMVSLQEKSIEHITWDCAHIRLPALSEEQQKKCVFAYGEKDSDGKTARKIQPEKYPYAQILIWPNYGHCTMITENPREYVRQLKKYL